MIHLKTKRFLPILLATLLCTPVHAAETLNSTGAITVDDSVLINSSDFTVLDNEIQEGIIDFSENSINSINLYTTSLTDNMQTLYYDVTTNLRTLKEYIETDISDIQSSTDEYITETTEQLNERHESQTEQLNQRLDSIDSDSSNRMSSLTNSVATSIENSDNYVNTYIQNLHDTISSQTAKIKSDFDAASDRIATNMDTTTAALTSALDTRYTNISDTIQANELELRSYIDVKDAAIKEDARKLDSTVQTGKSMLASALVGNGTAEGFTVSASPTDTHATFAQDIDKLRTLKPQPIADMGSLITAYGYYGYYDGNPHSSTIYVPDSARQPTIKFSTSYEGPYNLDEIPTHTEVGEYTDYYKVYRDGEEIDSGEAPCIIKKANCALEISEVGAVVCWTDNTYTFEVTKNTANSALSAISSNEDVATASVSGNSIVLALNNPGEATITVKTEETNNYFSAEKTFALTVTQASGFISTDQVSTALLIGDEFDVTVTNTSNPDFVITTSGSGATYTQSGDTIHITGTSEGTLQLKITAPANIKYTEATTTFTVFCGLLDGNIELDAYSCDIKTEETFVVNVLPTYTGGDFVITNSNSNVCSYSRSGNKLTLTALAAGSAKLTIATKPNQQYRQASVTFNFNATKRKGYITTSVRSLFGQSGNSGSFQITSYSGSTVNVASSNTSLCTVSKSGNNVTVYFHGTGSTDIILSTPENNQYASASLTIPISTSKTTGVVKVDKTSVRLAVNGTSTFSITQHVGDYTVTSSNSSVATVNRVSGDTYQITAISAGTCSIAVNVAETELYTAATQGIAVVVEYGQGSISIDNLNAAIGVSETSVVNVRSYSGPSHSIRLVSGSGVASYTASGNRYTFTGLKAGQATYEISTPGTAAFSGASQYFNLTVKLKDAKINLTYNDPGEMSVGSSFDIQVRSYPSGSTLSVASSNTSIATVAKKSTNVYTVTAVKTGHASITFSTTATSEYPATAEQVAVQVAGVSGATLRVVNAPTESDKFTVGENASNSYRVEYTGDGNVTTRTSNSGVALCSIVSTSKVGVYTLTVNCVSPGLATIFVEASATNAYGPASTMFPVNVEGSTNPIALAVPSEDLEVPIGNTETFYIPIPTGYTKNISATTTNGSIMKASCVKGVNTVNEPAFVLTITAVGGGYATVSINMPADTGYEAASSKRNYTVTKEAGFIELDHDELVSGKYETRLTFQVLRSSSSSISVDYGADFMDVTVNGNTISVDIKYAGRFPIEVAAAGTSKYEPAYTTIFVNSKLSQHLMPKVDKNANYKLKAYDNGATTFNAHTGYYYILTGKILYKHWSSPKIDEYYSISNAEVIYTDSIAMSASDTCNYMVVSILRATSDSITISAKMKDHQNAWLFPYASAIANPYSYEWHGFTDFVVIPANEYVLYSGPVGTLNKLSSQGVSTIGGFTTENLIDSRTVCILYSPTRVNIDVGGRYTVIELGYEPTYPSFTGFWVEQRFQNIKLTTTNPSGKLPQDNVGGSFLDFYQGSIDDIECSYQFFDKITGFNGNKVIYFGGSGTRTLKTDVSKTIKTVLVGNSSTISAFVGDKVTPVQQSTFSRGDRVVLITHLNAVSLNKYKPQGSTILWTSPTIWTTGSKETNNEKCWKTFLMIITDDCDFSALNSGAGVNNWWAYKVGFNDWYD